MYLPIVSLNRSQNVRIGRSFPNELGANDQRGLTLFHATHVNLLDGNTRRNLQQHSAIGAYEVVGSVTEKWVDLYASTATIVSAGTGLTVDTAAFSLYSRLFTDQAPLSVAATTNTIATPSSPVGDTIYLITVGAAGQFEAIGGGKSQGPPVYEVDSVAVTGTLTAGTFTLSFTYNNVNYVTAAIAYDATAAAVASAVEAATPVSPGPLGVALPTTITGSGGPIGTAAVTLTASGLFEGPISNQAIDFAGVTGATGGSFTQTTAGSNGASFPTFNGSHLPLAFVLVPQNATAVSTIQNIALTS